MNTFELKSCALLDLKAEGDAGQFSGYGSTYNLDLQGDRILPGSFAQSIKDKRGKVPILLNHNDDRVIGFSTSLAEDGKGLAVTAQLNMKTSGGSDAFAMLQAAQQIDFRFGLSIGFIPEEQDFVDGVREIRQIDLWEISLTPFPAQPKAFVADVKTYRGLEKHLRDVGCFSKTDAKRIMHLLTAFQSSSGGTLEDTTTPLNRRLLAASAASH